MKPDLISLPFDHFQRYGAASSLVESLGGDPVRTVLEVGANRQRILKDFMPGARFVFSDLEPQDPVTGGDDVFIQADATQLPFADREFDIVVSLDVMEHIPPALRRQATSEMARTAARAVIIGCPLDHAWVHEAETEANAVWERHFGVAYPWLDEHKEFGLVDPEVVEGALRDAGMRVIRFGQGDASVWTGMMSAHFVKEAVPELAELVASADRLYNERVFAGDRSSHAYREFFVAVRSDADYKALSASHFLNAPTDESIKRVLAALPGQLRPVVERLARAEKEWSNTAMIVRDLEETLYAERDTANQAATAKAEIHAAAIAERDELLRRTDEALASCERRAIDLALSSGQLISIADSFRDRNDELNQDLAQSIAHREILTRRVHTIERRQRFVLWGGSVFLVAVVTAALVYHFVG